MYIENDIIIDNIFIDDKYADPCRITVIGNGGLCTIPHFDLIGADLYCCIPILEAGFLEFGTHPAKNTLTLKERRILNGILKDYHLIYSTMTNWQVICESWNNVCPYNNPKIDKDYYMNQSNMPNYAKQTIYFIDNALLSSIERDGSYTKR